MSRSRGLSSLAEQGSGQGLIEVMIAAGIVGIALVAAMQFAASGYRNYQIQRAMATRNRLILQLTRVVGMPATITQSFKAPENPDLGNCILNPDACDTTRLYDLTLLCPSHDPGGGASTCSTPVTGPPSAPTYYDSLGYGCAGAANCPVSNYPFQAFTQFQAVCQLNSAGYFFTGNSPGFDPAATNLQAVYTPPSQCSWAQNNVSALYVKLTIQTRPDAPVSLPEYVYTVGIPAGPVPGGRFCMQPDASVCF